MKDLRPPLTSRAARCTHDAMPAVVGDVESTGGGITGLVEESRAQNTSYMNYSWEAPVWAKHWRSVNLRVLPSWTIRTLHVASKAEDQTKADLAVLDVRW